MKEKVIKIIDFFIEAGVLLIVFLVPVYFSFFYQNYTLFSLDKAVLFKVLTEFLLILVLLKILLERRIFFIAKGKYIILPLIFLLGLAFSTVISIDWRTSFWGSYTRQDGLFIHLHYFLFFLIVVYYINSRSTERGGESDKTPLILLCKRDKGNTPPSKGGLGGFTPFNKGGVGGFLKIERIITAILAGSFIVSLYGILQALGIEFIPWQKDIMNGQRVISTMGQPVFLGNYLLLVIFLTVYKLLSLTMRDKITPFNKGGVGGFDASLQSLNPLTSPLIRGIGGKTPFNKDVGGFLRWCISKGFLFIISYFLLLLSQLLCLVFTYTRGAWLGFIFGIIFAIFLFFYTTKSPLIKGVGGIKIFWSIIFLIIITTVLLFKNPDNFSNSFFISRLKSIADFKSGSLAMRVETWKAGLALWSQAPVIGYGLESQHEIFIKYYNPLWSVYEKINSSSDRAHNIILDLLLQGGVVLLLSYAIFIFGVFYLGIKKLKDLNTPFIKGGKGGFLVLFFLLTGLAAYHFSLFFSFPMVEMNVLFWAYIGIIIFLLSDFKIKEVINFKEIKKVYFVLFVYFFIIFASLSVYFIIDNIKSVKADYYFKKGRTAYLRENYPAMLENYTKTFNLNPVQEYYYWFYINDLIDSLNKVDNEGYRRSVFNYFEWVLADGFGHIGGFQRLYLEIKIYPILGKYIDASYFKKAELAFNNMLTLTPFYPDAYYLGGRMYFMEGDYKKALAIYNEALAVLPDLDSPLMNNVLYIEHRAQINRFMINVYLAMIECYDKLGDYKNQIILYNKIISIDLYFLPVYKKIADVYYKEGKLDEAIYYNKRGYMLGPNDYAWPYAIALLYKETGNNLKALEYAQKALTLNKENEDIKRFIENLNNKNNVR